MNALNELTDRLQTQLPEQLKGKLSILLWPSVIDDDQEIILSVTNGRSYMCSLGTDLQISEEDLAMICLIF